MNGTAWCVVPGPYLSEPDPCVMAACEPPVLGCQIVLVAGDVRTALL